MKPADIPNLISIFRIIVVAPIVWALLNDQFGLAIILFAIAGASDGIDGFLAKHFHWESRLGSILDPLADKLLLVASFATLTWLELLPVWLLWLVLARDVLIVGGGVTYHYIFGKYTLLPVWSSKINTLLQILLVLLVIIQHYADLDVANIIDLGIGMVVFSVIISGLEYVFVWGSKAWQQHKKH